MNEKHEMMTVDDVATYLRVAPLTIYRMTRQKKLPGFRIGTGRGSWRFRREEIEAWTRKDHAAK